MRTATGTARTGSRKTTTGPMQLRVHAYLHRKEGDSGNAAYWYRRAARPIGHGPLDEEWRQIAIALLAQA
jgi:hypothetical protein